MEAAAAAAMLEVEGAVFQFSDRVGPLDAGSLCCLDGWQFA